MFINKKRLINEFMRLVQIDSETRHEKKIAHYLKNKLTSIGLRVEEDNTRHLTGHEANNFICTLKGSKQEIDSQFFVAHMDTVKPGKNIQPKIVNDYIVSNGNTILGADDKAAIAVLIEVILLLKEQHIQYGELQFIFTVGEERGLIGAKHLDYSLIKGQSGYVLDDESPIGTIVTGSYNHAYLLIHFYETTSHTSIQLAKMFITLLKQHDFNSVMEINYFKNKMIHGEAIIELSIKLTVFDINIFELFLLKFKQTFNLFSNQYNKKLKYFVDGIIPGYYFDKKEQFIVEAKQAIYDIGEQPRLVHSKEISDANMFAQHKKVVNLSVGYELIHTCEERIKIDNLVKLTRQVKRMIEIRCEQHYN